MLLLLALLLDCGDLFIEQILVIHVKLARLMVARLDTLPVALNLELVFVSKFEKVLLAFLKAERRRDLIINVQLDSLENDVAKIVDDIAEAINQVASAIDQAFALVKQLATVASHDDEVAHVVNLEVSHDVS